MIFQESLYSQRYRLPGNVLRPTCGVVGAGAVENLPLGGGELCQPGVSGGQVEAGVHQLTGSRTRTARHEMIEQAT